MTSSGVIKRRADSWQVDLSFKDVHGVQKRIRCSYPTEQEAELAQLRMRAAILEGSDPRRASGRRLSKGAAPETLEQLRTYCLDHVWAGSPSEDTVTSTTGRIIEEMGESTPIKSITTGSVRELITSLQQADLAPSTVKRIVSTLGRMLTVALEERWISDRPKLPHVHEPAKEARFLSEDELTEMFQALLTISQAAHDLAVFLLWTGCRVGEALSLTWDNVDLDRGQVTFTRTKSNKNRSVPIPERALHVMKTRHADGLPVPFAINQATFGKQWNRAKLKTGLDPAGITPHTLRHTCASRLVMSGISLYEVSKWLGHSSVQVTHTYAHLAPDHLTGARDAMDRRYAPEGDES